MSFGNWLPNFHLHVHLHLHDEGGADQLAVFHDHGLQCRTEANGSPTELILAQLQTLDVGYGYTADGGATFPFRGRDVLGPIGGMFNIMGGGVNIAEGANELGEDPLNEEGYFDVLNGVTDVVSGLGFASVPLQVACETFDTAVDFGRYGDQQAAELGWLGEDEMGQSRSWSDWAADNGVSVNNAIDDLFGNDTLGDIAGGIATLGSSVVGGAGSVFSGIAGFFSDIFSGSSSPRRYDGPVDEAHNVVGGSTIRGDGDPLLQQRIGPMGAVVHNGQLLQE